MTVTSDGETPAIFAMAAAKADFSVAPKLDLVYPLRVTVPVTFFMSDGAEEEVVGSAAGASTELHLSMAEQHV